MDLPVKYLARAVPVPGTYLTRLPRTFFDKCRNVQCGSHSLSLKDTDNRTLQHYGLQYSRKAFLSILEGRSSVLSVLSLPCLQVTLERCVLQC
jgi:hypothetical protein